MPYTYKILASGAITSTALTTFNTHYTVPSGKSVIINRVDVVGNPTNGSISMRIVPSGATPGASHVYSGGTGASQSGTLTSYGIKSYGPFTLSAGDFIQFSSESGIGANFFIFGVEIS